MNEPKNILIVRTDRIGDVVLSLPMACILKKYFKDCKISFLVRDYTKDLVRNHPDVDDVIILNEENRKVKLFENVKAISKFNFDYAIVVNPAFKISLIIFLSHIKERIGTGYRWYSFFFNKKVFIHRKYAGKHELEFNIDLLKQLGINENVEPGKVQFKLEADKVSARKIDELFRLNGLNNSKPVIIIHPGSGGSAVDLPFQKFKELVKKISDANEFQIILTGSESEKELCDEFVLSSEIKNFAGLLSLKELTALIKKSEILIANSTGPLHIAAAMDKYVIGFYPKIIVCSAKRWGPYSNKGFVFEPEIDCKNCSREQCEKLDCMNTINIDNVVERIRKVYQIISNNGDLNG